MALDRLFVDFEGGVFQNVDRISFRAGRRESPDSETQSAERADDSFEVCSAASSVFGLFARAVKMVSKDTMRNFGKCQTVELPSCSHHSFQDAPNLVHAYILPVCIAAAVDPFLRSTESRVRCIQSPLLVRLPKSNRDLADARASFEKSPNTASVVP